MALTETQRNFRKVQKELGIYQKYKPKRKLRKRTGVIIVIIASLLVQLPQRLYAEYQIFQHKQVQEYLSSTTAYWNYVESFITPLSKELPNVNYELVKNINLEHTRYSEMLIRLKPVSSFEAHHESMIRYAAEISQYLKELERVGMTSVFDREYLNLIVINLDTIAKRTEEKLKQGFRKEKIRYEIMEINILFVSVMEKFWNLCIDWLLIQTKY